MRQLRYWFKARFVWLRLTIDAGPLKGQRIGAFCGMRFIRGRYDPSAVQALQSLIRPGTTAYDIGAHVGYLSLVAAQCVGPQGRIIAFEPLPLNLRYLRAHLRANRVRNVEVVAACVSDSAGQATFDCGKGTGRGHLIRGSGGQTPVLSIDDEVEAGRLPPPQFIKMDVEGAELEALQGARNTLSQHRPTLLLSVHSEDLRRSCSALLQQIGYQIEGRAKPGELLAQWPSAA